MLWQEGFVDDVVDHRGTDSGLRVYQKEVMEGNTINNRANKASQKHNMAIHGARGDLTRYEVIPVKGGNIRENIPGVSCFRTNESEGKSCVFAMLGMHG